MSALLWFRQDLRLSDNPALASAIKKDRVFPVFILDEHNAGSHALGGASRWWLHHSLLSLDRSLGGRLSIFRGNPLDCLTEMVSRHGIKAIYWNRCYEPWQIKRDKIIKDFFRSKGLEVHSTNASLLWEPWIITKSDGSPYRVFTPFYRHGCLQAPAPRVPLPSTTQRSFHKDSQSSLTVAQLELLPKTGWDHGLLSHWQPGEVSAHKRLNDFINGGLASYKSGRDKPAASSVSRLSAHLHFGELSPHQLWHRVRTHSDDNNSEHFCRELAWREFSYSLLYHNPKLPTENLQTKFNHFPWIDDDVALRAWQKGKTGIPMVDAGMRELWQTGYMHNRVRMIVGSFLVKNLRLHWRYGAEWFWDTLVDADLANNSASWQWIAGCGADAAPYFRIFNPVTQGKTYDPEGRYIRTFVPELARLPDAYLFAPSEAPTSLLREAGIALGETYPLPIRDIKTSRLKALDAFHAMGQAAKL